MDFEVTVNHGMLVTEIEKILVLNYSQQQIDDCIYFLDKRGYILVEDLTIHDRRHHYSLTQAALDAIQSGKFTEEEQKAFKDAWLDLRTPGMFGTAATEALVTGLGAAILSYLVGIAIQRVRAK